VHVRQCRWSEVNVILCIEMGRHRVLHVDIDTMPVFWRKKQLPWSGICECNGDRLLLSQTSSLATANGSVNTTKNRSAKTCKYVCDCLQWNTNHHSTAGTMDNGRDITGKVGHGIIICMYVCMYVCMRAFVTRRSYSLSCHECASVGQTEKMCL